MPLATGLLVVLGWRATYLLLALSVAAIAVPALLLLVREPR